MLPRQYLALAFVLAGGMISPPGLAASVTVTVRDLQYRPAEVKAKVGDTVVWLNRDVVAHTATVKGAFDVTMEAGKAGRLRLKQSGTFDYYCRFHPNMTGKLDVQPR
jgi:plastocyanin